MPQDAVQDMYPATAAGDLPAGIPPIRGGWNFQMC